MTNWASTYWRQGGLDDAKPVAAAQPVSAKPLMPVSGMTQMRAATPQRSALPPAAALFGQRKRRKPLGGSPGFGGF